MTGEAVARRERLVLHRPPRLQLGVVVAQVTKLGPVLGSGKRFRVGGGVMAAVAPYRGYGVVGARLQEFRLDGRMGIVAECATALFHRIVAVRLLEGGGAAVVTAETELRLPERQEVLLIGAMGEVARLATVLDERLVNHLLLECPLVMALVAHLVTFGIKEMTSLGSVGIMAEGALAGLESGVDIGPVHANLFLAMTLQTEGVAPLFQEEFRHDAVTLMTFLALLLLDHRMHISKGEVFFREFLVAIETILLCELQCRPRGGGNGKCHN